jgi:GT2 family glycosyltransferase
MRASVIMPIGGPEPHLADQLDALARQDVDPASWELIMSYNYAGGAEHPVDTPEGIRNVVHIDSSDDRGPAHARNIAALHARGEYLLFCDADDVVNDTWITSMCATLDEAEIVAGSFEHTTLNPPRVRRWRAAEDHGLLIGWEFLPWVVGANFAVRRECFDRVGGFDEGYRGGAEDADLGWRVQLAGGHLALAPDAVLSYRHRSSYWQAFRQHMGYGQGQLRMVRSYEGYAPVPTGRRLTLNFLVRTIIGPPGPSRWSIAAHGLYLARFIGALSSVADHPGGPIAAELFTSAGMF